MDSFPGGAISADGRIGVVHVGGDELVAIELSSGHELWRHKSSSSPVAASRDYLILLSLEAVPKLSVDDLSTGKPMSLVDDAGLPGWLVQLRNRLDALEFHARDVPEGLAVSWRAQHRRTGGTVKSSVPQDTPSSESGELTLVFVKPEKVGRGKEESLPHPAPSKPSEQPSGYAPLAGEVSRVQVGGIHYVLRIEANTAGSRAIRLEALTAKDSQRIWRTELGDISARSRPGPLRK